MAVDPFAELYVGFMTSAGFGRVVRFRPPYIWEPEVLVEGELNNGLYHYLRRPARSASATTTTSSWSRGRSTVRARSRSATTRTAS